VIQIRDPRHPLYGRLFSVICRTTPRGGHFPSGYEVEHVNGLSLLIPVAATEQCQSSTEQTKLSVEALRDLVSIAEALGSDEYKPKPDYRLSSAMDV
jgi:hypothetical protein